MKKRIIMFLVMALLVFSAIPVMAAESPTGNPVYDITFEGGTVGKDGSSGIKAPGGTVSIDKGTVKVGEKVTLTATPNNGNKFVKWILDGDYEIVSGSLTDTTIIIIPKSDIDVSAEFVKADGTTVIEKPTVPGDSSVTSPKTGSPAGIILAVLLVSGVVAFASKKKISE